MRPGPIDDPGLPRVGDHVPRHGDERRGPVYSRAVPDDSPRTALLDLDVTEGSRATIVLSGELDPATAPQLDAEIERILATGAVEQLVLDLAGLTFLDSSGLRVFVTAREAVVAQGGELSLRGTSANARRLLDVTGLGEIIDVE